MQKLFIKENIDIYVTDVVTENIKKDIKKEKNISEENILILQKKILKSNKLDVLEFDIDEAKFEFTKEKPVPVFLLNSNRINFDGDLFFGTIYCSLPLISGMSDMLFTRPKDFEVNDYIIGNVKNNVIKVELPTTIYNVELNNNEDQVKFNEQKSILKNYLVNGKMEINKEITLKNVEIENEIVELLNSRKNKLQADDARMKFINK